MNCNSSKISIDHGITIIRVTNGDSTMLIIPDNRSDCDAIAEEIANDYNRDAELWWSAQKTKNANDEESWYGEVCVYRECCQ